jgi:flagella basal body P-ring formation protein FlgA
MYLLRSNSTLPITRHSVTRSTFAFRSAAALGVRFVFGVVLLSLLYSVIASAEEITPPAIATIATAPSASKGQQPLATIRSAAEQFVRAKGAEFATANTAANQAIFAVAAELDSRLQLDFCPGELKTFALNDAPIAARTTIGVRCEQGATWTVYVPVSVESEIDALVLRNSMMRDAHVAAADIDVQRRRVPGLANSYIINVATLREQHLKRSIPAGTVLQADMVARDLVIKRGQQVLLVFDVRGLAVQAPGLALADGGMADRIRVQNQTSLKVVEGVIESGNLVRVGM